MLRGSAMRVPFRDIAGVIGRHLKQPVVSISGEEADAHFGFLSGFPPVDNPTSSTQTQELPGWRPAHPGLIPDLEEGHSFRDRPGLQGPARTRRQFRRARTSVRSHAQPGSRVCDAGASACVRTRSPTEKAGRRSTVRRLPAPRRPSSACVARGPGARGRRHRPDVAPGRRPLRARGCRCPAAGSPSRPAGARSTPTGTPAGTRSTACRKACRFTPETRLASRAGAQALPSHSVGRPAHRGRSAAADREAHPPPTSCTPSMSAPPGGSGVGGQAAGRPRGGRDLPAGPVRRSRC
jgi:hypothetical protein